MTSPPLLTWPAHDRPRERLPRERLPREGSHALSDAELVAILLGTGGRGRNAVALAQAVLARCGGVAGLARWGVPELPRLDALGPAKASRLVAALALAGRLRSPRSPSPSRLGTIAEVARARLAGARVERLVVLVADLGQAAPPRRRSQGWREWLRPARAGGAQRGVVPRRSRDRPRPQPPRRRPDPDGRRPRGNRAGRRRRSRRTPVARPCRGRGRCLAQCHRIALKISFRAAGRIASASSSARLMTSVALSTICRRVTIRSWIVRPGRAQRPSLGLSG